MSGQVDKEIASTEPKKSGFSFSAFASWIADKAGHPATFICAALLIIVWAACGPIFDYSDTWQLIINTSTTIITFLMVFVIQHTQNKDTKALQLKLDELIRSTEGAHNVLLDLEKLEEEEICKIEKRYLHLAKTAREKLRKGETDTNKPDVEEDFNIG